MSVRCASSVVVTGGDGPCVRDLLVMLPDGHLHRLYTERLPDDWAHPGCVKAWNGDRKRPTLTPSTAGSRVFSEANPVSKRF